MNDVDLEFIFCICLFTAHGANIEVEYDQWYEHHNEKRGKFQHSLSLTLCPARTNAHPFS